MVAGILENDGLVYGNKTAKPWHNHGKEMPENYDYWSDVYEGSQSNYTVEVRPLFMADGVKSKFTRAIVRTDNNMHLSDCGPAWTPLQNKDMYNIIEPLVQEGELVVETAGTLFNGLKSWMLCKTKVDMADVLPNDPVKHYVLISNTFDGKTAIKTGFTPIRVVCANTEAMARNSASSKLLSIRHHSNVLDNMEKVVEIMDLAKQEFIATIDQYRILANMRMNAEELKKYVRLVFEIDTSKKVSTKMQNILNEIEALHEIGAGSDITGVRGTVWGAYNAITEYANHVQGRDSEKRLDNVWFGVQKGRGRKLIDTAFDVAMKQDWKLAV